MPYSPLQVERQAPNEEVIEVVRNALQNTRKPMICAGRGVLVHRAEAKLIALAEAISASVLRTVYGDGSISDDHPLSVGIFDEWSGNSLAWDLMEDSDLLLMVGMRSDTVLTRKLAKRAPRNTFLIALDEPHTFTAEDWLAGAFTCDLQLFLERLLENVDELRRPTDSALQAKIAMQKKSFQRGLASQINQYESLEPLHFGFVLQELAAHMAKETIVVAGWGNHREWARTVLPVGDRESFIAESAWGTLGYELPSGIAAKLVNPDRQVIMITGDGSLLMTLSDLVTAVEEGTNILVVVLNDSRYGIINLLQEADFGRSYGDKIGNINFARIAEGVGAFGVRIETPNELAEGIAQSLRLSLEGPVVLDAVCRHPHGLPNKRAIFNLGMELSGSTK